MRIVVTNTKGGVGKTTTSMFLAAALARSGAVELWDADPQGSASEWALRAKEDGVPLGFPVRSVNRPQLRRRDTAGVDFIVVDTGPGDVQILNDALAVSDVAIVPTSPSAIDMARTWETEVQASKVVETFILLTQVDARTRSATEARKVLQEAGVGYFDTVIPRREAIRQAFGSNPPNDLYGYEDVIDELMEVTNGRKA